MPDSAPASAAPRHKTEHNSRSPVLPGRKPMIPRKVDVGTEANISPVNNKSVALPSRRYLSSNRARTSFTCTHAHAHARARAVGLMQTGSHDDVTDAES
jgi:hypothetical protein